MKTVERLYRLVPVLKYVMHRRIVSTVGAPLPLSPPSFQSSFSFTIREGRYEGRDSIIKKQKDLRDLFERAAKHVQRRSLPCIFLSRSHTFSLRNIHFFVSLLLFSYSFTCLPIYKIYVSTHLREYARILFYLCFFFRLLILHRI